MLYYNAKSLPSPEIRAAPQGFLTYEEAERERDSVIAEHVDGLTNGVTVVRHEALFYVVYGRDIHKGFHDYDAEGMVS